MKNLYLFIAFTLLSISAISQSGWQVLSSSYTNNLNDVMVANDSSAICVGGNSSSGHVLYTVDSGVSWTPIIVSTSQLNAVDISSYGAWVVGNGGKIYYTNNGINWTAQSSGTTTDLQDVDFPTPTTGYTVGGSGVILKTTNGTTWSNPIISGGNSYTIKTVDFTSATNGAFGGDVNSLQGFFNKTTSGATYFSIPSFSIGTVNDFSFISSTLGFAVCNGGNIYKTTNGGSSWILQTNSGTTQNLNAIDFVDANHAYIVGDTGTILKTSNGGTTWVSQNAPSTANLNGVSCLDSNVVYAVGDGGTIIKTYHGGSYLTVNVADDTSYCSGYTNLIAHTNYNGFGTLSYTWASSPYLSTTTDSLTTAGPLTSSQTFYVTVSDGTLSASDSATVYISALPSDSICLVTVDDSLGHNLVVFEKHIQGAIHHYNIYAESAVAGIYDSIGFIPVDSAGIFIDTNSNPAMQSYSYKISTVDSCGNESMLSDFHKTMHLSINQGSGNTWNLIWNYYEGIPVQTYKIWRADTSLNWTNVGTVPGSNNSWTDLTPPAGGLYYQVEIISPYVCKPYDYKANTNYNNSRSNTANNGLIPSNIAADFSSNVITGIVPLDVNFTNQSTGTPTTYIWKFGDGDTAMTPNPTHTYTTAGTYTVTLIISDPTTTDSIVKTDYIDALPNGIGQSVLLQKVDIYPNPLRQNNSLFIKHEGVSIKNIEIINILGKMVPFKVNSGNQISEITFNNVAKGIYFIRLTNSKGQSVQKKFIIR
jgi:photosystem II stability/assembly factor-like uncharacterized protein